MTMSMKKDPETRALKDLEQFVAEIDVFQFFYGALAVHKLKISVNDIMDIMDCDASTADSLLEEVRQHFEQSFRKRFDPTLKQFVTVWQFCDYMDIDELLIQLFLLELHPPRRGRAGR